MDPTFIIRLPWAWRPEIMLSLGLAAVVHLTGRQRLKRKGSQGLTRSWRSVSYLSGLAILWIALMSPIDILSDRFFYMHMIQHLLLVMIAPPLLLIANPMPIMLWGLPSSLRLEIGRGLRPGSRFRQALRPVTTPGLVWLYFVAVLVGWHDLEHLSFFGTAVLFWWHVIGCAPHIHRRLSQGVRIGYALSMVPANALTGIAIALASEPIYEHYTTVPRLGEMTALQDQEIGGVIMWIPGSMMYIIAALILIAQMLRSDSKEGAPTEAAGTEETVMASGSEANRASHPIMKENT